jgi:hypothetical protein
MSTDRNIVLPSGAWTLLTPTDIVKFSMQHVAGRDVLFRPAVGAVPPDNSVLDGLRLPGGVGRVEGGFLNQTLFDLTPTGDATRVYARPNGVGQSTIYFLDDGDTLSDFASVEAQDVVAITGFLEIFGNMAPIEAIDVMAFDGTVV